MQVFTQHERTRLMEAVDAAYAKAHAATTQDEFKKIFAQLKPKQIVWVSYTAVMSTGSKEFRPYIVGRRSHSKKYGSTSMRLLPPGEKVGQRMKIALWQRGEGNVTVALGDMAASLLGIYVEK